MTEALSPTEQPRIVWCAASYGYGDDLMYYEPILREFCARFPRTAIPVARTFPVGNYPDLPLVPILSFLPTSGVLARRAASGYLRLRRIPTVGTVFRLLRRPADVHIIIEFTPLAITGFLLARLRRRKCLLLVESDPRLRGARNGVLEVAVKRYIARRVNHVLVSNSEGAAYLDRILRVPSDRVTEGPYLTSTPPSPPAERRRGDRPDDPIRFLYVGSVTELKGLLPLVDAMTDLGPDCAGRWTLDVVGDGSALETVRRRVEDAGLDPFVRFHGAVRHSAVWSHYADADVVVNPTLSDYRSLSSFEAVNAGRPALLSCHDGAASELQRSGAQVVVVRPDDRTALTAALRRYVLDQEFLAAASLAARTPPPQFSLPAIADNLERAVRSALAG